jgi:hypothetical protein
VCCFALLRGGLYIWRIYIRVSFSERVSCGLVWRLRECVIHLYFMSASRPSFHSFLTISELCFVICIARTAYKAEALWKWDVASNLLRSWRATPTANSRLAQHTALFISPIVQLFSRMCENFTPWCRTDKQQETVRLQRLLLNYWMNEFYGCAT